MFWRKSSITSVLLLVIPAVLSTVPPARADGAKEILDLVPGDAWGFAVIRSLDTIDSRAALLKETLGLEYPTPITAMAFAPLNLGDALDVSGRVCAVMMDYQKFGGPQSAVVALLPAKDPKVLLEKLLAEEPIEGISKCTVMGQPAYAAVKKKFLIVGPNQECVTAVAKAEKTLGQSVAPARLAALEKSDLYFSILAPALNTFNTMFMPFLQMATAATDPEGKALEPLMKVLTEAAAFDLSLSIDQNGLSLGILTAPKKDSDLEKLLRETKNTDQTLLSVLPKEKYLIAAGAITAYGEQAEKFGGGSQLSTVLKTLFPEGLDEQAVRTLESGLKKLAKSSKAWAMSLSALPPGPDGMLGLALVIKTEDADGYTANLRKLYKAVWAVSDDEDVETVKESVVHQPDAETIADRKVDTITANLPALADMLGLSEEDLTQIKKVLGNELVLRFGPADDNHVALAFGGGKKRFEKICQTLKSGGKGLAADPGISKISARLPTPRASEGFFAVDNLAWCIKDIVKLVGEEDEFKFDIPTVDAPLAFSTVQLDSVQRVDFIVPMKLITAAKTFFDTQMSTGLEDFDEDEDEDEDEDDEDEEEDEDEGDEA